MLCLGTVPRIAVSSLPLAVRLCEVSSGSKVNIANVEVVVPPMSSCKLVIALYVHDDDL